MDKNMCTGQKKKFIHCFIKSSLLETHLLKSCLFQDQHHCQAHYF